MKPTSLFLLFTLWLVSLPSYDQVSTAPALLTEAEKAGKKMFQQRCSVCHTPPETGSKLYGPVISDDSVRGRETMVLEVIRKGTPHMPGFQYTLRPQEIYNIVAYLKTVKKNDSWQQYK